MSEPSFSFRWGIRLLDEGDTRVPNFFFDRYTEAGVSRTQFLTILHLSRYQYEKAHSECRPSVGTVAKQMGYSVRGLQKVLATMEKNGLLKRRYRPGQPTIYDFTGFSWALLATELAARSKPCVVSEHQLELRLGGEPQFTTGGERQFTIGVNPSSPKEQHEEEQTRNDVDDMGQDHLTALIRFGVDATVARKLAKQRTPAHVQGWIAYADSATKLRDPVGLVVRRLLDDEAPPAPRRLRRAEPYSIRTTVCGTCGCTVVVEAICSKCTRCSKCCKCEGGTEDSME